MKKENKYIGLELETYCNYMVAKLTNKLSKVAINYHYLYFANKKIDSKSLILS